MTIVAPAAPPVQALVAGQALGRFTLLSDLTVRTDAPVWRARDRQLQRDVALKLPPAVVQAVPGWRSVQLAAPAVPLPLPSTQLSVS